jgi:predicted secreted protein
LAAVIGTPWAIVPAALAAPPDAVAGAAAKEDIARPGVYRSGRWEYRLAITAPGSKSEGTRGELLFDDKPVEEPGLPGDYYLTPWGEVAWIGDAVTMWGEHGWMLREPGTTGGHALVEPWRSAGGPVVLAMVLAAAPGKTQAAVEPWVRKALSKLGVKAFEVERGWFPLTDQALVLHDTKEDGSLTVRLAQAREDATLQVLLGGSTPARIDLTRKDGATRVVRQTLTAGLEPFERYLAFRVERAAPWWAAPLDVGPAADGQTIEVRGAHEIVIALPGDLDSGNVWAVTAVRGDAPLGAAVKALGQPQFVAGPVVAGGGRVGTFENVLRVLDTGTCEVELAYRRPWQPEASPEKTFRVTLEVVELPSPGARRWPGGAK